MRRFDSRWRREYNREYISDPSLWEATTASFKHHGPAMAVLDLLSAFPQGAAGATEELTRRGQGFSHKPLWTAWKEGIANDKMFAEQFGPVGLVGDILIDPLMLGPGKYIKMLKMLPGASKSAQAVRLAMTAADKYTETNRMLNRMRNVWGEAFVSDHYRLLRFNPKMEDEVFEHTARLREAQAFAGKDNYEAMMRLVSDEDRLKEIGYLLDTRDPTRVGVPLGKTGEPTLDAVIRKNRWQNKFDGLAENEKLAYQLGEAWLETQSQQKVATKWLEDWMLESFEKNQGRGYFPHRVRDQFAQADEIDNIVEGYVQDIENFTSEFGKSRKITKAETDALGRLKRFGDATRQTPKVEVVPGVDDVIDDIILKEAEAMRESAPFWAMPRASRKTLEARIADGEKKILANAAEVLRAEDIDIARFAAAQTYQRKLVSHAVEKGIAVPGRIATDPMHLKAHLLGKGVPVREATRMVADGFKPVKGIPGVRDWYVPAEIADEFHTAIKAYSAPDLVSKTLKMVAGPTRWVKGHFLFAFPDYLTRNMFSDYANMVSSGVNPTPGVIADAKMGHRLAYRFHSGEKAMQKSGIAKYDGKAIEGLFPGNMTEKQFQHWAVKYGVIDAGSSVADIGSFMHMTRNPKNMFFRIWNPQTNPVSRRGMYANKIMEDGRRAGAALTWLREGIDKGMDTKAAKNYAAKKVHEIFFDYRYGLTKFQKQFFQDFLVPFWAFTRFNLPLQLKILTRHPQRLTAQGKVIWAMEDWLGGPDMNDHAEAEWERNSFGMRIGYDKATGKYLFASFDYWHPYAEVGKILSMKKFQRETLGMLTPLKAPVEAVYNYSAWKQAPISKDPALREQVLGIPLDPRMAHVIKSFRPMHRTDAVINRVLYPRDTDQPGLKRMFRDLFLNYVIGLRGYPRDPKLMIKTYDKASSSRFYYLRAVRDARKQGGFDSEATLADSYMKEINGGRKSVGLKELHMNRQRR